MRTRQWGFSTVQMLFEQHERENDDGKVCPQHNHAPILDDSRRSLAARSFSFLLFRCMFAIWKRIPRVELREEKRKKATQQTSCLKCVHENIFVLHYECCWYSSHHQATEPSWRTFERKIILKLWKEEKKKFHFVERRKVLVWRSAEKVVIRK